MSGLLLEEPERHYINSCVVVAVNEEAFVGQVGSPHHCCHQDGVELSPLDVPSFAAKVTMCRWARGRERSASKKGGICPYKTGSASGSPAGANRLAERGTVRMLALK